MGLMPETGQAFENFFLGMREEHLSPPPPPFLFFNSAPRNGGRCKNHSAGGFRPLSDEETKFI
jgi:hypothetical protein